MRIQGYLFKGIINKFNKSRYINIEQISDSEFFDYVHKY